MNVKNMVKKAVGIETTWPSYLSQYNSAKQALLEAEEKLRAGNELVEKLRFAASATAGQIGSKLRLTIASEDGVMVSLSHYPDGRERQAIRKALKSTIGTGVSAHHGDAARTRIREYEQHLADIDARESALNDANSNVSTFEAAREEAKTRLADVAAQQPKATVGALEGLTATWHEAQEAQQRIAGRLQTAREELAQKATEGSGTHQVDELEAKLALAQEGDAALDADLMRAKKEIGLFREELQRLESVIRGLEKLEAAAAESVREHDSVRRQVGEAVFAATCAKAEQMVLTQLAALDAALNELNSNRSQLNTVACDAEYQAARVKIEGLHLYALEIPEPTPCLAVM